jgi:hypothetical protein
MATRLGFRALGIQLLSSGPELLRGLAGPLEPLLHELDDPLIFLGDLWPWPNRCHGSNLVLVEAPRPQRS